VAENTVKRGLGAIERIFAQAKKKDQITGYVGKPNGDGTYTIYTGYAPGWVYVRLTDAVDGSIAVAIAMNTNLDPSVQVEMERVDGALVIKSAVPAQAARLYGNNAPQAQQPPQQQPPVGYTNKPSGEISLVDAAGNALGGLVARITPFRHRGGYWDGNTTITLTPTATASKRAWVCVGINTKTNTITQALSADVGVGFVEPPRTDVNAVIVAYPDVDWRYAVNLANGETSIDAGDLFDLRSYGETRQKHNFTATAAPTTGDDADDGYGVGSIWIDVTGDDVYMCVDGTAGAAVWEQLNGASGTSATLTTKGDLLTRTSSAEARLAVGTDGQVLTADSSAANGIKWAAGGSGGGALDLIILRDEKAQNTSGGTFTSGADRTRTLNTIAVDTGGHCSLSSNQFTLAAGTYRIDAQVPAFAVNRNQAWLYNVSDSVDVIIGTSAFAQSATALSSSVSVIQGRFTIAASKTFEIRHRCNTTVATYGFGVEANFKTEVYTIVRLEKE